MSENDDVLEDRAIQIVGHSEFVEKELISFLI